MPVAVSCFLGEPRSSMIESSAAASSMTSFEDSTALAMLADSSGPAAIEALLNLQDAFAMSAARVAIGLNQPHNEVARALADSRFVKLSLGDVEGYTTREKWEQLTRFLSAALAAHHQATAAPASRPASRWRP